MYGIRYYRPAWAAERYAAHGITTKPEGWTVSPIAYVNHKLVHDSVAALNQRGCRAQVITNGKV